MTPLTLPGDLPGLLRRGSPVLIYVVGDDGAAIEARGVVVALYDHPSAPAVLVAVDVSQHHPSYLRWRPMTDISLDLSDATGRIHAAWWVAQATRLWDGERDCGVLWRWPDPLSEPGWWLESHESVIRWVACPEQASPHGAARHVPALADLDPDDDRRLDDGSRWVDAEALRLCCLHAAGRAP